MSDRRAAIVSLDFVTPAGLLFDKETQILNARPSFNAWGYSTVEVVLEHPTLDVQEVGVMLPHKIVVITQYGDGSKSIEFKDAV
jgi:hypothetical protein